MPSTQETSSFKGIHPGPKPLISQDLADLDLQADNLLKVRSLGDLKRGLTLRLLCLAASFLIPGTLKPFPRSLSAPYSIIHIGCLQ